MLQHCHVAIVVSIAKYGFILLSSQSFAEKLWKQREKSSPAIASATTVSAARTESQQPPLRSVYVPNSESYGTAR